MNTDKSTDDRWHRFGATHHPLSGEFFPLAIPFTGWRGSFLLTSDMPFYHFFPIIASATPATIAAPQTINLVEISSPSNRTPAPAAITGAKS